MTLPELFDRSLTARRDEIGLEFHGRSFTFGEMEARSNRQAHGLMQRGLRPGDRLCLYLANRVEMIDLFLACAKTGIIFVPINILYREREISHILRDADPAALVTDAKVDAAAVPVWRLEELSGEAAAMPNQRPPATVGDETPAGIIYTSGTTGASKGAVLSQGNFAANARTLLDAWRIASADRFLLALPLFHIHGLGNGLCCWLASGCRMRLLERFEHQKAAAEFLDFAPTLFFGVPTIYVRLLDLDDAAARQIGARMRLFVSGSAPLPAQVLEQFRGKFGHTILERYGMSETFMIAGNPYDGERRAGTVGLPLPGVSIRLLKQNGERVTGEETGEIYVRGPSVFKGYWRKPDVFVDGYFRTGDLATCSTDGYYTLCGRKSDLIISGGFNVYPREIEEFLQEQPEIAEAAVVARADAVRGEVPVAYVVLRAGVDTSDLEKRCRDRLASFKVPRQFFTIEKLPRNAMGKIQKHLL
ncbi:MAG TPA: AMP-binding protein [Candidatus Aquilonibacter sp.]|nr:AMP-binding protein [Candidatus Aquilonibacter sp.]